MFKPFPAGGGRLDYFRLGERAVEVTQRAMRLAGVNEPQTILDLPSGHGRVMRTLKGPALVSKVSEPAAASGRSYWLIW